MSVNTKRLYRNNSYVNRLVHASDLFRVCSYGSGQALTIHDLRAGTSVGVEGQEAFAVRTYAEALEETHPTLPKSTVWATVWRDFDMAAHARRDCDVAPVEYSN